MTTDEARTAVFDAALKWGRVEARLRKEEQRVQAGSGSASQAAALARSSGEYLSKLEAALDAFESVVWQEGREEGFSDITGIRR